MVLDGAPKLGLTGWETLVFFKIRPFTEWVFAHRFAPDVSKAYPSGLSLTKGEKKKYYKQPTIADPISSEIHGTLKQARLEYNIYVYITVFFFYIYKVMWIQINFDKISIPSTLLGNLGVPSQKKKKNLGVYIYTSIWPQNVSFFCHIVEYLS